MKKFYSKLPALLLFSGMLFLASLGACSSNKETTEEKKAVDTVATMSNDSLPPIDTTINKRPDPINNPPKN